MGHNPFEVEGLDATGRRLAGTVASSGGGIRTPDTRIMIPPVEHTKCLPDNGLRVATEPLAHYLPTDTCQSPSDLALVIEAWPTLPEAIRAGIIAMVRSASRGEAWS